MTELLRTLFLFYRRHLRVQPLRELMAVAGVAAGVALLFAVQVAHHSVTGSFEEIAHGLTGRATLEISQRGAVGFDQRISEEVGRLDGVSAVAPILEQPIVARGPKGSRALALVGATEQIAPLKGKLSSAFQRAAEGPQHGLLVLTEPTAKAIGVLPGGEVRVLVGERTEHLTLDAIVPSKHLGALARSPIAAAPLAIVQAIGRAPGRLSRVLIVPRSGRERSLRRALSARYGSMLNVRPVATEARLLGAAAGPEAQVTLLFSAISLVAGILLAFNALLLASEERRRFIASLVELGTPDSMVVASLAFDALILGALGCVLGLLAGDALSLLAFRSLPGYIAAAFAIGGQRVIALPTVLIALASGMAAAFAAAALPAFAILRGSGSDVAESGRTLSLMRKLRPSESALFGFGFVLLAGSSVTAALAPTTTVIALVGLAVGLVICLPMSARWILRAAQAGARRSSDAPARLSVAELRSSPARAVALLATGTVAAFLVVLIGGSVSDVQHAARTGAGDLLSNGQLWIRPGGPENVYTTQPFFYSETQDRVAHSPEIRSVLPWRDAFLDLPGRRVWVLGVPPQVSAQIAPSQLIEGSLATADRRLREGGWIAISKTIAQEDHVHVGDSFAFPTPSGTRELRIAATIANYGWLPGALVMNGEDQARMWRDSRASELSVSLAPGASIASAKRTVEAALPHESALSVQTDQERRTEVSAVLGSTLSRLSDTTVVVLVATLVSVITLMMAAIWQRRGRLNALTSIGLSSLQFARMVAYESGLMLLSGCLIGSAAGVLGQYLIDGWLHETTGASLHYSPAWVLGLRTVLIAAAICAVASMVVVAQTAFVQRREAFSLE